MTFDQARRAWKNSQPSSEELAQRVLEIRALSSTFESNLLRRDWTETIAAAVVIIAFLPGVISFPTRMAKFGGGLIMVHAALIALILWLMRKRQPDLSADRPTVEYLTARRQSVERQTRLLAMAPWWYVAPSLVGQILVVCGLSESVLVAIPGIAICCGVCVIVAWINVRAAWYQLPLLRDSIQVTLNDLLQESSAERSTAPNDNATAAD